MLFTCIGDPQGLLLLLNLQISALLLTGQTFILVSVWMGIWEENNYERSGGNVPTELCLLQLFVESSGFLWETNPLKIVALYIVYKWQCVVWMVKAKARAAWQYSEQCDSRQTFAAGPYCTTLLPSDKCPGTVRQTWTVGQCQRIDFRHETVLVERCGLQGHEWTDLDWKTRVWDRFRLQDHGRGQIRLQDHGRGQI